MKNRKMIVRRAWGFYRTTVRQYPDARTRVTLAECFRAAWKTPGARLDWDALNDGGGAAALHALACMAWRVKARTEADGRPWADWIQTPDDARSVAGEAWTRVPAMLDRAELAGDDLPLAIFLYRATAAAVRRIYRDEHAGIIAEEYDPEYGRHNPDADADPADRAATRDAINRAALDDTDRAIISAIVRGYTVRQIAEMTATTKSTVQRHIDAIRARLAADLAPVGIGA